MTFPTQQSSGWSYFAQYTTPPQFRHKKEKHKNAFNFLLPGESEQYAMNRARMGNQIGPWLKIVLFSKASNLARTGALLVGWGTSSWADGRGVCYN
jgi:hypothetical protein